VKSDVFPAGLRLTGLPCLVIGAGADAAARARSLGEAGAVVRVVQAFTDADLDGIWLAVLTDRDAALAERVFQAANTRRIFFCAVDQPEFCTFSHLALARSGDLTVGVTTNGKAPALARRLREELERLFSEADIGSFVARLAALRERTPPEGRRSVLGEAARGLRFTGKLDVPEE
jgi:precorrin-2 dehydrogenase/sirohydrochlorin ferrochelatase